MKGNINLIVLVFYGFIKMVCFWGLIVGCYNDMVGFFCCFKMVYVWIVLNLLFVINYFCGICNGVRGCFWGKFCICIWGVCVKFVILYFFIVVFGFVNGMLFNGVVFCVFFLVLILK